MADSKWCIQNCKYCSKMLVIEQKMSEFTIYYKKSINCDFQVEDRHTFLFLKVSVRKNIYVFSITHIGILAIINQ